uniref:Odorant receptor n=1 Tax=Protaetia brevitarsis TaxID=348688 RepID=A0A411HR30_PROBE|nr:odorant receptor [Protaetia brevitarsis]
MTLNGRRLLDLPCAILAIFGIGLFSPAKISLWCLFLLLIQFLVFITALVAFKDLRNMDADIWVTGAAVSQGIVKVIVLLIQKPKFSKIADALNNFQLRRGRSMTINAKREQKFVQFGMRCQRIYTFIVTWALFAFITKPVVKRERITPSPAHYFCNIETLYCYVLQYTAQCWAATYTIYILVSVDCLFWSLLSYAYLEMEHIKDILLHLQVNKQRVGDDWEVLEQISFVVEHHAQILSFVQLINDAYSGLMIYQCACTFFIVGMSQFCLTINGFPPKLTVMVTYVPYYVAGLCQMFTYCIAGDIITNQAKSIGDAAFNSHWWIKHQPKLTKALCLVIQRSQRTLTVTVGGLWVLNLETYSSIIKTTMTMLAFVKTIYEN